MHGSPLSKWDNRDLWKKYNYKDFGIIAEPYFDIDFSDVFYITDAGRAWNNENVSIRDKVKSKFTYKINSTDDIIDLVKSGDGPDCMMIVLEKLEDFHLLISEIFVRDEIEWTYEIIGVENQLWKMK